MDHCVTPETVAPRWSRAGYGRGLVVSPTYYGVAADLASIERIVHGAGKLMLVDEAWGPHFHFHPALPLSATAAGADCVSTRRTKCSRLFADARCCTRGATACRLDRLKAVLKMFLSTSPNLPMLASLDVARKQMATEGPALLSRTIALAQETRRRLNEIDGTVLFRRRDSRPRGRVRPRSDEDRRYRQRPRIYRIRGLGNPARGYNIQVELADLFNLVALFTIGTTREAADRLVTALGEMARDDRKLDMFAPSGVLEQRLRRGTFALPPDSADAHAPARRVPRARRVRAVPRIGRENLRRNAYAVSAGHPGHRAGRRNYRRDRGLRSPRVEGGRAHSRTLRRRVARRARGEGVGIGRAKGTRIVRMGNGHGRSGTYWR